VGHGRQHRGAGEGWGTDRWATSTVKGGDDFLLVWIQNLNKFKSLEILSNFGQPINDIPELKQFEIK
jgi:hypothetical protein